MHVSLSGRCLRTPFSVIGRECDRDRERDHNLETIDFVSQTSVMSSSHLPPRPATALHSTQRVARPAVYSASGHPVATGNQPSLGNRPASAGGTPHPQQRRWTTSSSFGDSAASSPAATRPTSALWSSERVAVTRPSSASAILREQYYQLHFPDVASPAAAEAERLMHERGNGGGSPLATLIATSALSPTTDRTHRTQEGDSVTAAVVKEEDIQAALGGSSRCSRQMRPSSAALLKKLLAVGDDGFNSASPRKPSARDVTVSSSSSSSVTPSFQSADRIAIVNLERELSCLSSRSRGADVHAAVAEGATSPCDSAEIAKSSLQLQLHREFSVPCGNASQRFACFRDNMLGTVLRGSPTLRAFAASIFTECERCLKAADRSASVADSLDSHNVLLQTQSELMAARRTVGDLEKRAREHQDLSEGFDATLNEVRRQLLEAEASNREIKSALAACANRQLVVDAGRPFVSASTSAARLTVSSSSVINLEASAMATSTGVLVSSGPLRADDLRPGAFTEAVRRLGAEIESLRADNAALCEHGMKHVDAYAHQSREMAAMLQRTNAFQQQVGSLKLTIKVMRDYITKLESSVHELRHVYGNQHQRGFLIGARKVDHRCAASLATVLDAVVFQSLMSRGIGGYLRPQFASGNVDQMDLGLVQKDVGVHLANIDAAVYGGPVDIASDILPAEGGQLCRPLRFAMLHAPPSAKGLKFEPKLNIDAFRQQIRFIWAEYYRVILQQAQEHHRRSNAYHAPTAAVMESSSSGNGQAPSSATSIVWGNQPTLDQFLVDYFVGQSKGDFRRAAQLALVTHSQAERYSRLCVEASIWLSITHACDLPGDFLLQLDIAIEKLKVKLRQVEPVSKKMKDRISRADFVRAFREVFKSASPEEVAAIAWASSVSQDKPSDDVSYETFFPAASLVPLASVASTVALGAQTPAAGTIDLSFADAPNRTVYDTLTRVVASIGRRFSLAVEATLLDTAMAQFAAKQKTEEVKRQETLSAEVRRLLSSDEGLDPAADSDGVTLAEVRDALLQHDPTCTESELRRRLACIGRDPGLLTTGFGRDAETTAILLEGSLRAKVVPVSQFGLRIAHGCFMMPGIEGTVALSELLSHDRMT